MPEPMEESARVPCEVYRAFFVTSGFYPFPARFSQNGVQQFFGRFFEHSADVHANPLALACFSSCAFAVTSGRVRRTRRLGVVVWPPRSGPLLRQVPHHPSVRVLWSRRVNATRHGLKEGAEAAGAEVLAASLLGGCGRQAP